ncbi:ser/Thr protein phosphatase family protein [Xylogone sp. PMI_703]|nr:ser/Thr protein phosphatase family protein [Xylogone sp. PMI_703]
MSTNEPARSIPTRFFVISDTHNFHFENVPKYEKAATVHLQQPVPKADVVIHCGDLTMRGGADHYRDVIEMIGSLDAELKLVIAGNHDLDLDKDYWRDHNGPPTGPDEYDEAIAVMTGPDAIEKGINYLEEGLHTFTLKNGAKFTVYASPYQPEFCGFAFPYLRHQDRFNTPEQAAEGMTSIAENPVPDFPGVDIMMTHGPPRGILDKTFDGVRVGCDNLLRAAARARPRMYCFGHIHEGHGSSLVTWKSERNDLYEKPVEKQVRVENSYPESSRVPIRFGEETLMVNGAIMNLRYRPGNAPWVIDLDLPATS